MLVKCDRKGCAHSWDYTGKSKHFAVCPMCRKQVKISGCKRGNDDAVSPVVSIILMIAIVMILAAVVAAYAFGIAGEQKPGHTTGFSVDRVEDMNIRVGYVSNGGAAVGIRELDIQVDGVSHKYDYPTVGQHWVYSGSPGNVRVYIVATYEDGGTFPVMDRYV